MLKVFISTGDASGDWHGAEVAKALQALNPGVEVHAVGGHHLQATGATMLHVHDGEGRIGPFAYLSAIPSHVALLAKVKKHVQHWQPHVVLLIDYGGYHLKLAPLLPKSVKRCYYIPPQVWASRKGRIKVLQQHIDHVFCIFPFEEALYQQAGVPVTFVGHPVLSQLPPAANKIEFCKHHGLNPEWPIVAVLPGSRTMEISYLLEPFLQALPLLQAKAASEGLPPLQFVVAKASNLKASVFNPRWEKALQGLSPENRESITLIEGQTHELLSVAQFGLAASGTVTLEAALYGTPVVIAYKGHPLAYWLVKPLIKVPYIGLPNLLVPAAQAPVLPELYQNDVNPLLLATSAEGWLNGKGQAYQNVKQHLLAIRKQLGSQVAAKSVARALVQWFL